MQSTTLKLYADFSLPRPVWVGASLVIVLLLLIAINLSYGSVAVSNGQVIAILLQPLGIQLPIEFTQLQAAIIWQVRLPRVVLGLLVGGGLAVCGVAMQGLFRNPLADPALLGVSSGAALGAVMVIVLGATVFSGLTELLGAYTLPIAAFLMGFVVMLLVYVLGHSPNRAMSVATLLLAGIAINAFSNAILGLLTYLADDEQLRTLTFWLLGSLGSATWSQVLACLPLVGFAMLVLPLSARALNALLLGESEAAHLGFAVERLKIAILILVALATGATVAVSGIIGFIGLVVPHLLRLAVTPDHRFLMPASLLAGAALILLADLLSRTIVSPAELPIGIITALIGAPFFVWLLWREKRRGYAES